MSSIPGLGRSPERGSGNSVQSSCLGNPIDRAAWRATVHGAARVGDDLATKPPLSHAYLKRLAPLECSTFQSAS